MRLRAAKISTDTIGRWGCLKCGTTVNNGHTGPCSACGGLIGRIVPTETPVDTDLGGILVLRDIVPQAKVMQPKRGLNLTALSAAAVLCIASPLLVASSEGWNAVTMAMALNIWSSSVGYYALAIVPAKQQGNPRGAIHA